MEKFYLSMGLVGFLRRIYKIKREARMQHFDTDQADKGKVQEMNQKISTMKK